MKINQFGKKSMYEVIMDDGTRILVSYRTPVAAYIPDKGLVRTDVFWSVTTSKHIGLWGATNATRVEQSLLNDLYSKYG